MSRVDTLARNVLWQQITHRRSSGYQEVIAAEFSVRFANINHETQALLIP
jgi:hypothetical protein